MVDSEAGNTAEGAVWGCVGGGGNQEFGFGHIDFEMFSGSLHCMYLLCSLAVAK